MAQVQRTTPATITFPTVPPQYPSGSAAATIAGFKAAILTLKNVVVAGHVIEAVHYRILAGIYNAYRQHTHAYPDLRGVDTFGNLPTYGGGTFGAPNPKSTSDVTGSPGPLSVVTPLSGGVHPSIPPGSEIHAADYTPIRNAINFMQTHSHTISDQTS
jgi:hypothetical protein